MNRNWIADVDDDDLWIIREAVSRFLSHSRVSLINGRDCEEQTEELAEALGLNV